MTDKTSYKVSAMTVTFVEAPEDMPRPWESIHFECEEYQMQVQNPRLFNDEKKCRHIREAEMYHHFADRVSLVEDK